VRLIRHNGKRYQCVPCGLYCWSRHVRGRIIFECPKCGAIAAIPLRKSVFGQYPYCKQERRKNHVGRVHDGEAEENDASKVARLRREKPEWFDTGESGQQ